MSEENLINSYFTYETDSVGLDAPTYNVSIPYSWDNILSYNAESRVAVIKIVGNTDVSVGDISGLESLASITEEEANAIVIENN